MATTTYLQDYLEHAPKNKKQQTELERLEQFALHGVDSFGQGSIVIQGRGIQALIKRYFDHYKAIMTELYGKEKGEVLQLRRKEYTERQLASNK